MADDCEGPDVLGPRRAEEAEQMRRALALIRAVRDNDSPGIEVLVADLLPPLPPEDSPHHERFKAMRQRIIDTVVALALTADTRGPSDDWLELSQQRAIDPS